ncbi:dihydroorotase [Thermococcus profundus]|uniref:Dihydroorotase n=1 Tax=Thermococcus profundus TaxID=49899 RepID=A0A2Z2MIA9_THEPR|nr:dihydroorotase [Thermococcus profundus]ASJ03644.1 dihydroorotase [Thermococcus profundus]
MHELVIAGKFVTEEGIFRGSVGIDDGKIRAISTGLLRGEEVLNLGEDLILPGLIDVHVHLRDFEEKHKETIESGTKAAIHGGITTVFDMPNTRPPIMDLKTFERREHTFRGRAYSDYAMGFLVSNNCEDAKMSGADFFKVFMGASTGGIYSKDFESDYSCAPGVVSVHAEDARTIQKRPERPPEAEIKAVERVLLAAEKLRKPLNICHVSTGGAIKAVTRSNLPWVSFEVTPHHLFLSRGDYERNGLLKVYPPLRGEDDIRTLWENFRRIPIIASDHAPHTIEDKKEGAAGIPGLETEVALLLDGVNRGLLSITDIVKKMHLNPIRVFGIRNKGFRLGADADFTVVDLKREWIVKPEEFYTKAKWSPWEGKRLRGKAVMTLLRGEVVMEEDEITGKPRGVRIDVR